MKLKSRLYFYFLLSVVWFFVSLINTVNYNPDGTVILGFITPLVVIIIYWSVFAVWAGCLSIAVHDLRQIKKLADMS